MSEEESQLAGERGRPAAKVPTDAQSAHPRPCGQLPRNGCFLSDSEVIASIGSDEFAFQLWRNGYERGLMEGACRQQMDDEQLANLAAAIAISRVENQVKVRDTIRNAIKNIDVLAAREATRRALASRTSHGVKS